MASSNNRTPSSNNRTPSSSPNLRHRSLDTLRYFGSTRTNGSWNNLPFNGHRTAVQAVQLANQLQQLQVNSDVHSASTHATTATGHLTQLPCRENESSIEEELVERLKEVIDVFMSRPHRRYVRNTTIRWTIDHGNQMTYNVAITIHQPLDII